MKYLLHAGHSAGIITTIRGPQGMYFHLNLTDRKPEHSGDGEVQHVAELVVS